MNKNREQVNMMVEHRDVGNWNYRDKDKTPVYTKPIAVIKIDKDEFVWKHEEILRLIEAYLIADFKSIEMITDEDTNTGEVDNFETPFIEKIQNFLDKWKN